MNKISYVIKKLYSDNEGLWLVSGFAYLLLWGLLFPLNPKQGIGWFELFLFKIAFGAIITAILGIVGYLTHQLYLVLKEAFISAREYAREYDEKNKKPKDKI